MSGYDTLSYTIGFGKSFFSFHGGEQVLKYFSVVVSQNRSIRKNRMITDIEIYLELTEEW